MLSLMMDEHERQIRDTEGQEREREPASNVNSHVSPTGAASGGNKRRRVRKACLPCRQRKRKCDAEEPCGMCTQYGYDCVYPEDNSPLAPFVARKTKSPKISSSSIPGAAAPAGPIGLSSPPTSVSVHSLQSQTKQHEPPTDHGMMETTKGRYVGFSSAFAFPRTLGLDFQSKNPPPLHSFAYTLGIRPEEKAETHCDLRTMISEVDVSQFSGFFFQLMSPIFDILESHSFYERCRKFFVNAENDTAFGAVVAGVTAVGSFLAIDKGHARELDLVQYAKRILEDPKYTRKPSLDQVVGWLFRILYLRATTRPNNAWLASCQAVHLCEAIGLHDEACIRRIVAEVPDMGTRYSLEQIRRIFWTPVGVNTLISCEYGRACVVLPHITTEDITPRPGNYMHLQHRLAKAIPSTISSRSSAVNTDDQRASLFIAISAINAVPIEHPFLALTKGDLCFCFYRRLRQHHVQIPPDYIQKIIDIGDECLDVAVQYAREKRPLWPVLGAVFQFACVLLALDTQASLARVSRAFRALEEVVANINTHMSREALATARLLLRDAMGKKRRELALLEGADGPDLPQARHNAPAALTALGQQLLGQNGDVDLNIDWDQIFKESYNWSFGGSPQFDEAASWVGGQGFAV